MVNDGDHVELVAARVEEDGVGKAMQVGAAEVSMDHGESGGEPLHLAEDVLQLALEQEIETRNILVGVPLLGGGDVFLRSRAEVDSWGHEPVGQISALTCSQGLPGSSWFSSRRWSSRSFCHCGSDRASG